MQAYVMVYSYGSYGGQSSASMIGDLLEHIARDADCGVDFFDATICVRDPRPPMAGSGLEGLPAQFNAELDGLPKIRWERSKRKLSLRYESRLGRADGMLDFGPPARELLLAALSEMAGVIEAQREVLSRKPGFDEGLFIATLATLGSLVPATDAALEAFRDEHKEQKQAERSLLPWWEQLEIDWAKFHPTAKQLLNDPFFWSEDDDNSPHGNDTGHDLLSDFRTWRRSHKESPPAAFLALELRRWDFSTDWLRAPLEQWDSDVETSMSVHDEAAIALAFALLKLEGSCDGDVRTLALDAIARQVDPRVVAHFGWQLSEERRAALEKLRLVLGPQRSVG